MLSLMNLNIGLCCLLIFLISCSTPAQQMDVKSTVQHQTSHVFNLPIGQTKYAIISAFETDNQINSKLLNSIFHYRFPETNDENDLHQVYFTTETNKDTLFSKEYFRLSNSNDIYLHAFSDVWDSPVYYVNDKPLKFRCEFAIKLDSIDNKRTKVTIKVLHPRVMNGTIGIGPHGSVAREVVVKPTTVEEATLLQYLAMEMRDTSKIQ